MSSKPKLFVPDYVSYATPFLSIYDLTDNPDNADTIMFTGGADIATEFYGEPRGQATDPPSMRDVREMQLYERALAKGKSFLGICRGAQLLCALAGGKLAQDIDNHCLGFNGFHRVSTSVGKEYQFNSLHHQMMIPWAVDGHQILAWTEKRSPQYLDGWNKPITGIEVEPEVVYFSKTKALGIQCHPEAGYRKTGDPAMEYFHTLVKEKLL